MRFHITKDRILRGARFSPSCCPAALAVSEDLGILGVQANRDYITIDEWRFPTPESVRLFMDRYDHCEDKARVRPITFALPVEETSLRKTEQCPHGCTHSFVEHVAFDRGVMAGEAGYEEDACPYERLVALREAWLTGRSVGALNRKREVT